MNLSRGERRTLAVTGSALVLLLAYAGFIRPLLERGMGGGANDLATRMAESRALLARAAGVQERHGQATKALTQAEGEFLIDTDAGQGGVSLLALVERIATQDGVALGAKGLGQIDAKAVPCEVRVEIEGRADPAALVRFLASLASAKVRLELNRLELVPTEGRALQIQAVVATLLPHAGEGPN